jgi:hypothetical protein
MTKDTGSTEQRKTAELCGHESDAGRCIKSRGHDGEHEYFPNPQDLDLPTVKLTRFADFDAMRT